jgi:hypothetical protein
LPVVTPSENEVRTSWERLLSLPRQGNPAVDMTGANCPVAQSSPGLWFLQSTIGGSASRACTIPANREIICNVISCELSDAELPGETLSDGDLIDRVRESIDRVNRNTLSFRLDNVSLINQQDWRNFRVLTNPSQAFLPDTNYDNLFRVQGGSTRFAADGYYVKLTELPRGPHTLYFGGVVEGPGGIPIFDTAVNYKLTQL